MCINSIDRTQNYQIQFQEIKKISLFLHVQLLKMIETIIGPESVLSDFQFVTARLLDVFAGGAGFKMNAVQDKLH